jgi:hypothetical protein
MSKKKELLAPNILLHAECHRIASEHAEAISNDALDALSVDAWRADACMDAFLDELKLAIGRHMERISKRAIA